MAIRNIRTLALASVIAMGGVVATTGFADAHRWCGKHYGWHKGWHYGWHKGWHGHRTYARVYRPTYYGMSRPAAYGYGTPYYGGYSTPGYYGSAGYCNGGMFGGSGLFGLGTGIL